MGLAYRHVFALVCSGLPALLFVIGLIIIIVVKRNRVRKARTQSALGQGEDILGLLLATSDEAQTSSKCRRVLVALLHFLMALVGGGSFLGLAAFDYMAFWVAALLASLVTLLYWAFVSDFAFMFWQWRRNSGAEGKHYFGVGTLNPREGEEGKRGSLDLFKLHPEDEEEPKNHQDELKQLIVSQILKQLIPIVVLCVVWFGLAYALVSTCIALHPTYIDTRMTRSYMADPCDTQQICHMYLLAGTNMSSEVSIVFHSGQRIADPIVRYGIVSGFLPIPVRAQEYVFEELEKPRYIYYAYLDNLNEDTVYYFKVVDSAEKRFKTPQPFGSNTEIRFSTGGDTGLSETTKAFFIDSVKFEPGFVSIGGDLSYDNGLYSCYKRMDAWLDAWEAAMTAPSGNIVPLLTAIGNHEYGGFSREKTDPSFYLRYFVHEKLNGRSPLDLNSYRPHYYPGLLHMALDTNVVATASSQQDFIKQTLQGFVSLFPSHWRTALYHFPMFPGKFYNLADSFPLRDAWEAIFSQFSMDVGFENHGHTYKVSKLIKSGEPGPTGTLYVGDGTMGVGGIMGDTRDNLDHVGGQQFYFRVRATQTMMNFEAVGADLTVFDRFNVTKSH